MNREDVPDSKPAISDERETSIEKISDYMLDAIAAAGMRLVPASPETSAAVLAEVREHAERWANRPPTSPYAMGLRDAWRTILRKIDAAPPEPAECLDCGRTDGGCDRVAEPPTVHPTSSQAGLQSFRGLRYPNPSQPDDDGIGLLGGAPRW